MTHPLPSPIVVPPVDRDPICARIGTSKTHGNTNTGRKAHGIAVAITAVIANGTRARTPTPLTAPGNAPGDLRGVLACISAAGMAIPPR